ncbi:MAG: PhzF family phenazine biosynthesis protein [Cyanobacteria bacterium P01_F01_bin.150]
MVTQLPMYQVDAFASRVFSGNPAAIVVLEESSQWLEDKVMQAIAAENNLSETAFIKRRENDTYDIRWFTPTVEVDLCGHATLASAHVIFSHLNHSSATVSFSCKSGALSVEKKGDVLALNFPTDILQPVALADSENREVVEAIATGLSLTPLEIYRGRDDYLIIADNEYQITALKPDMAIVSTIPARGIIVSAPGTAADFVSRFFAPQSGIPEDPVTGSAHTSLIPYWSKKLGKTTLKAQQLSARGGELFCLDRGACSEYGGTKRVEIGGHAQTFMMGQIFV